MPMNKFPSITVSSNTESNGNIARSRTLETSGNIVSNTVISSIASRLNHEVIMEKISKGIEYILCETN